MQRVDSLRLSRIVFRFGASPSDPPLEVGLKRITILVGPNNSGKTQTLRDIETWSLAKSSTDSMRVLSRIDHQLPDDPSEMQALLTDFRTERSDLRRGFPPEADEIFVSQPIFSQSELYGSEELPAMDQIFRPSEFFPRLRNGDINALDNITRLHTMLIDEEARRRLIADSPMGYLLMNPPNPLSFLYLHEQRMQELSDMICKEFGMHVYIDPTDHGKLMLRVNKELWDKRRSLDDNTLAFFLRSPFLRVQGSGIRHYVAMLIAISALKKRIILLDDPEAFLHPPSARNLGKYISRLALDRKGSVVITTHSADFLIGCLEEASDDITIIRLTYDLQRNYGTARQLAAEEVNRFLSDPLLRATDTMSALFHKSAIVTESDGDRVFYSEINRRLSIENQGISDTTFLNAGGKQTVHRIAAPLRQAGIPAAVIYDLDVLKYQEQKRVKTSLWENILMSLNIPRNKIAYFENERRFVETELCKKNGDNIPDVFKKQGIMSLSDEEKNRALSLLKDLKVYGIFIVPIGELEEWLSYLGIQRADKSVWFVEILEKMTQDDTMPRENDVWEFIKDINKWISNEAPLAYQ